MFKNRRDEMDKLLAENAEARRIFNRHQELHKRVNAAEIGGRPMEDLALNQLKKEKLWAKDQLAKMLEKGPNSHH